MVKNFLRAPIIVVYTVSLSQIELDKEIVKKINHKRYYVSYAYAK